MCSVLSAYALYRAAKEERDMTPTNLGPLLATLARERTSTGVLETVARGLAATDGVALVRIWRTGDGESSLHLAASAGDCADAAAADSSEAATSAWWGPAGVREIVRLPLLDGDETIGLLVLFRRTTASADEHERLGIIAAQTAAALVNAVAFEELQSSCANLRAENSELRESLQDLFEEAPIAYVHEALDTRFIRANRAALNLLGVASADVPRTFGHSFVAETPENQRRLRDAFAAVGRGDEARRVVLELRRKDNGKPVWVEWWSRPSPSGQYTRTMMVDITERVLIEKTKAALELSLESGQVGDWDLDLVHDTSRLSRRHDLCFGYDEPIPEAEWGAARFAEHLHAEDRERVIGSMRAAVASRLDWMSEFRVIWPDGSLHWLVARGRVHGPAERPATRMLGIVMDVTERKKVEDALRETKAALDFALESAHIGDWDLDLIHDTSRRSLRHDECFGYREPIPQAEWGIDRFLRHVHEEDRERVGRTIRDAAADLSDWGSEFRVVWPDETVHWLAARGGIYRTEEEKATRMLGIVMDITERKRGEESLRASEQLARAQAEALSRTIEANQRLDLALRGSNVGIWDFDVRSGSMKDAPLHTVNLWEPLGYDTDEPPEKYHPQRWHPDDRERMRDILDAHLRGKTQELNFESRLIHKDGSVHWRVHRGRTIFDKEGKPLRLLGSSVDIGSQKALEEERRRASAQALSAAVVRERNRFAREVHDTLAQGFTGVIVQLEASADARSNGLSQEADDHVQRASDLARESLREARRSVMALRPMELEEMDLTDALEALTRKLTAGTNLTATFAREGDPRTLPPEWEANLVRIVQEVMTNALRHAHADRVDVRIFFKPNAVALEIRDDGCGFNATLKSDGFGLLGIRERVEEMGGTSTVETANQQGTAVLIALPYPKESPEVSR